MISSGPLHKSCLPDCTSATTFKMMRLQSALLLALLALSSAQDDLMANMTSDQVHISCDTMQLETPMPNVKVVLLDDAVDYGQLTNETYAYDYGNETLDNSTYAYDYGNETFDNQTVPSDNDTLFNDDMMTKLHSMGFPFAVSCLLDGDSVDVSVSTDSADSADGNSTQIVELMVQVHVNGTVSGSFFAPLMPQDYQLYCRGQAVAQIHNDPKESMKARWFNLQQKDLSDAACVLSILDTDGNFWQMIKVPASGPEEEMEDMEKMPAKEADVEFTATEFDMVEESNTTQETADKTKTATEQEKTEVQIKPIEDDMGDLGQTAVDGQTYEHHCINNNMMRVLVPYTGCSDFLTVVGGLPRSYQACGLEQCFDVNSCSCKACSEVTCEKLAPGTTHTYSISIYDAEGKEVGVVSGERTRTASGGLTESISATGDPRSTEFPLN